MTFPEFSKTKPVLYGSINHNGKQKIGSFVPKWVGLSNSLNYILNGRKGNPGFTLKRAWELFEAKRLTTNPEDGKPENYL